MRKSLALTIALSVVAAVSFAQEPKKVLSPPAKAEAKFGEKNVTINYNAPSKRERVIMGELVPYGKVWRTGANAATTLQTDVDLMIGTLHVPAGKYTLFTIPGEKEWTLIVNKQSGLWGTSGYDEAQNVGTVKMAVKPVKNTVETFNIAVTPSSAKKGTLTLTWENTQATVPVLVH